MKKYVVQRRVDEQKTQVVRFFNKVAFDGSLDRPCDGHTYSQYSVEQINKGAVAWLFDRYGSSGVSIQAGTTLKEFKELVKKAGGKVYE